MKTALRKLWFVASAALLGMVFVNLPVLAAEGSSPNPADTPVGVAFRWLNFALVFGAFVYVIRKAGTPYFRSHAQSIAASIQQATEARAAAERELSEASQRLAALDLEIQDLRRAAVQESAAEAERIRNLARAEAEKISQAARAEIEATERVAAQELRSAAASLATERAATLLRAQMTVAGEAALFHSFVGELQRSAS